MKKIDNKLAIGVVGIAYYDILIIIQTITHIPILTEKNLVLILLGGTPLEIFLVIS